MRSGHGIMAVVTTSTSHKALLHQSIASGKLAPAAGLVCNARHVHFCASRSNPQPRQHDESRPAFRLFTCAITCTHAASITTP
jgi:hypothetical protein